MLYQVLPTVLFRCNGMLHISARVELCPSRSSACVLAGTPRDYIFPFSFITACAPTDNELGLWATRGSCAGIEPTITAFLQRYIHLCMLTRTYVQQFTSYHTRLIFSYRYLAVAHQAISSPFLVSGLRRKPLATQLVISIRLPEIVLCKIRTRLPNIAGSPTMRQNIKLCCVGLEPTFDSRST